MPLLLQEMHHTCILILVIYIATVSLTIALYIISWSDLRKTFWSLRKRPIVLSTLFIIIFKYSSNHGRLSKTTPKCFCELALDTLPLLKTREGWFPFSHFPTRYYFPSLLAYTRVKTRFPLVNPFITFYTVII